jgi:hypothetical protein
MHQDTSLYPVLNFTFAVITDWQDKQRVFDVCDSIRKAAGFRDHEILIIGGSPDDDLDAIEYTMDKENVKLIPAPNEWITTKKNIAAWIARYDKICLMHDYFLLDPNWFTGYEEFSMLPNGKGDWDICSNPQYLINGQRHFTDWVTWDSPDYPRYHSLNYWDWTQTKYQYISGGYFLVKRKVLIEDPFNAFMKPGEPEDVEWSLRVRNKYTIKCNPFSSVTHNKIHRDVR